MDITVINEPYDLCFVLGDHQLTIDQFVAVRGKSAVPAAFFCLLFTSCHGLGPDVFTLDLRNSGQHGDHQLPGILGTVDPVFHADQVHTEILHQL